MCRLAVLTGPVIFAVLLDRRVVLASGQLRLPTLVGEALGVLLWPFR